MGYCRAEDSFTVTERGSTIPLFKGGADVPAARIRTSAGADRVAPGDCGSQKRAPELWYAVNSHGHHAWLGGDQTLVTSSHTQLPVRVLNDVHAQAWRVVLWVQAAPRVLSIAVGNVGIGGAVEDGRWSSRHCGTCGPFSPPFRTRYLRLRVGAWDTSSSFLPGRELPRGITRCVQDKPEVDGGRALQELADWRPCTRASRACRRATASLVNCMIPPSSRSPAR